MNDPVVVLAVGALLGTVLGLLGGGGGILAVPLLVAIGEPVLVATTMSLVIVGAGAAAALVPHSRAGRVDWPLGLLFGALGSAGAVLGSRLAVLAPAWLVLAGLAVMLVVGAAAMLRSSARGRRAAMAPGAVPDDGTSHVHEIHWGTTVLLASAVGLVTGFFGVGAGFVVVPALVAALRLPVKRATATALVVIVMNSAVAYAARHDSTGPLDLTLALAATTAAFGALGAVLSHRVPGWVLSGAFGMLMAAVAVFTLSRAVLAA